MFEVPSAVSVLLFDKSSYPASQAGCTAVSALPRLVFTEASSFDSSIEPALIVAVKSLAVIARSISVVSDTVSIVFTSAPDSIPASLVFSVAEYCL